MRRKPGMNWDGIINALILLAIMVVLTMLALWAF